MVGRGFLAAGLHVSGVAEEAVLQLLLVRLLQPAEHAMLRGHGDAVFLADIFGEQGLEECHAAVAVCHCVEEFDRDAVALVVYQHTQRAFAHLAEGRMRQRAAALGLNLRRFGQLLKVVPEYAGLQAHGYRREAAHRHVQRGAQHRNIDRLRKLCRETEEVDPVAALRCGVYFCCVVKTHPAKAARRRQNAIHELVYRLEVRGHVLAQTVEHVGVPALRRNDHAALAAGGGQLFVKQPRVVQHYLVTADEQQRRRQTGEVAEERGTERIRGVVGVALGVELQQLLRHRGVDVLVRLVGVAGAGEIRPRRDADKPAGQRLPQLLELQAQREDESAARALAAEHDLLCGIAFPQEVVVAFKRIVQRRGVAVFGRKPVSRAEYAHSGLRCERRAEALGVFETAAGVAAAVQVQNNAVAPLILGHDPCALKATEIVLFDHDLVLVERGHELAELVLPLAGDFKRAVCDEGFEKVKL